MAETVKKSRIVSGADEDLEESLLEEFNLRLKNCMSRDDLQNELEGEATHVYENVEVIRANGASPVVTKRRHRKQEHEPPVVTGSEEFLEAEREHYGDLNGCGGTPNGHQEHQNHENHQSDQDQEVENLEILDSCSSVVEQIECESTKTDVVDVAELDRQSAGDAVGVPRPGVPTTCLFDASESVDSDNPDLKSVKDRMFLSTGDASCLLFTQTVTSPMLTPSEENIDFLKGFRRESSQYALADKENGKVADESPPPVPTEQINQAPPAAPPTEEIIYENTEFLRALDEPETNVENLEPTRTDFKEQTLKFLQTEIYFTESPLPTVEVENCEVVTDLDLVEDCVVANGGSEVVDEVDRAVPQEVCDDDVRPDSNVQVLKTHFMKNEGSEPLKSPRLETSDELDELKSLNIMKQISKFESTTNSKSQEFTNVCANISVSTVTQQSHFVETTTEMHSGGDMNFKKKKNKKSKNQHEKENISVNETNMNEDQQFYNVNVKNLCRSFGDLTKIEGEQYRNRKNNERSRTKSMSDFRPLEINKKIENVFAGVSVRALKSSFSKFDALQKKNVLNSNSSDQEQGGDGMNCKQCGRAVFQMEKIIAERCVYHRNCFRCVECGKQLLVDNFESHEGTLYCRPHFRALFAPKAVEDDAPSKPRKHEVIIRENQPAELPPGVVRASDKPDLGLEELHSLNVKERFQVFEKANTTNDSQLEKNTVKMERSPSILSKLARFQARGMNVGVSDDALNGVPVEFSSEEEEEEEEVPEGEDADLVRAKRVQKEKPFHFSQMNDVKSKWEQGNQLQDRDERREERKQEIQNIRSKLFMGKQGKMKEAYQQAIMESGSAVRKEVPVEAADTRSIKDRFEKGEIVNNELRNKESEDMTVFESGLTKQSRSIFQELDATGGKAPKVSPSSPPKLGNAVRSGREAYLAKQASEDMVRSSDQQDEITVRTADIQDRFKFFETYKEPQQKRREFRMTPPREGQIKSATPERELYVDPEIVRSDDYVEDSVVAKSTQTASKMLNKFRQMEENLQRGQDAQGPRPLKRFTPPREPLRRESSSEGESGSEESEEEVHHTRMPERDLLEAQKAARAKQLKAKFERWEESEQTEVRRDSQVNMSEEFGDDQSQTETARSLRAKFESLRETTNGQRQSPRVKVNRFVAVGAQAPSCESCHRCVYPLEKITVHGHVLHKNCFRCKECHAVLRMDSFTYNQGLLYCTTHFKRLFISKGNYDTAFGLEQHKEKWNVSTVA